MTETLDIAEIQAAVRQAGASWQAAANYISQLPPDQRRRRLGAEPGPSPEELKRIEADNRAKEGVRAISAPASFDWRNVNGANYITPIKDQGNCGSCVAFGSVAAVEANFRIQRGNPNMAVDLSEAHLFYCIARSQGRNCDNGWSCASGVDACKQTGVPDEACYPYTDHDQDCTGRCGDWQNRLTKITGWHEITSRADMKEWIASRGPLVTRFDVYTDFYSYSSGVYRHVTGGFEGGHCVCVVGYEDANGCWICKNSWGNWGDNGFFRIAYGDSGIGVQMWAIEGIEETGWLNTRVLGAWTIDQDRNAWVYLDGVGWRRIAFDNDNIFLDLLTQLISAKGANRPISVYQQQGIIRQVYVF